MILQDQFTHMSERAVQHEIGPNRPISTLTDFRENATQNLKK